jgi:hypothetical protein
VEKKKVQPRTIGHLGIEQFDKVGGWVGVWGGGAASFPLFSPRLTPLSLFLSRGCWYVWWWWVLGSLRVLR